MDYLARLVTPYLVSEIDTAAKKQQKGQSEHQQGSSEKPRHEDDAQASVQSRGRYYGIEDRRKNKDRRQQLVARGRWIESRTKRDRRKDNQFKTMI